MIAVMTAVVVFLGMAGCSSSGPSGRSSAGTARQLPGLSALVPSGALVAASAVTAVSCPSPGNCVAGGSLTYVSPSGNDPTSGLGFFSFVAEERGGAWQPSRALGGLASEAVSSKDGIQSLSCSSPGTCVAAGAYGNLSSHGAFIVTEQDGAWGTPIPVPGLPRLTPNVSMQANGLACWAAGNCVLAGTYGPPGTQGPGGDHVFWASQVNGTWGPAAPLAGLPGAAKEEAASASVTGVACSRDGTCAIAVDYRGPATQGSGFLATVAGGKLGAVTQSGLAAGPVSCPPAGDCVALSYISAGQVAALTLHDGTWSQAPVPGLQDAAGLSCPAPGACTAGGRSSAAGYPAAVVSQASGTWQPAVVLQGTASLSDADLTLLACADPRDCVAAGEGYNGNTDATGHRLPQWFIAVEKAGTWSPAQDVPGLAGLDGGRQSGLTAIASPAPGAWIAGGTYDAGGATSAGAAFLGLTNMVPFVASVP
jgi:hypothetical protein